jgi:hypothetical protein
MGRKKSSGTPGPRVNDADVGRRRGGTEDLFTGGGERRMAGDGAATGFPGGGACEDGEVRGSNWCGKEGAGAPISGFIRGGRERATTRDNWPLMAMEAAGCLKAIKGALD